MKWFIYVHVDGKLSAQPFHNREANECGEKCGTSVVLKLKYAVWSEVSLRPPKAPQKWPPFSYVCIGGGFWASVMHNAGMVHPSCCIYLLASLLSLYWLKAGGPECVGLLHGTFKKARVYPFPSQLSTWERFSELCVPLRTLSVNMASKISRATATRSQHVTRHCRRPADMLRLKFEPWV